MTKRLGFFPRLATLLLVIVCLCMTGLFSTTAYAADDDVSDASFYKMASAASGYLNNLLAEGGVPSGDSGIAGGLMGYCDEADDSGIIEGWIASALSISSATFSYDALTRLNDGDSMSSSLYVYCRYGYLLQALGLDSTSNESMDLMRLISGFFISLLYYASVSIPAIFSAVLDLLIMLNPFQLFAQTGLAPDAASGAFANLMVWLSDMYDGLSSLSWSLSVPLFFFALVVTLLLFKVTDKSKRIKKYLLRIIVIVIGVPICGSLYTTALDGLDNVSAAGNATATRVILSTFCDFEAWAKNQLELDAPDSSTDSNAVYLSSTADGSPSGTAVTYLRRTCYNINRINHDGAGFNGANEIVWDIPAYTSSGNSVTDWNADSMSGSDVTSSSTISDIQNLLSRYMSNSFFYASDWETYAKANMDFETVSETIGKTDSVSDFIDNGGADLLSTGSMLWGDGNRLSSVDGSASDSSYIWFREGGRLSTMAMYNYLSSKFTESSVVVYSNAKAASGFVRESHKSVNLVGDGLLVVLIYFNSFVLLGTSVVMGWCYAFALIVCSMRRSVSLILSVPFALLGSLRGGAKLVTHTIVLILEIVGTIFLYNLVSEMMMLLSEIVEVGFADAITNMDVDSTILFGDLPPVALFTAGPALMALLLLISIILMIWFTIVALRLRKSVVRGLDDAANDIISKFFEVGSAPPTPDKPGMLASAAGGAAAGAGAALARKALAAGSNDSKRGAVASQEEDPGGPGGPDEGDEALGDGDDDDGGGGGDTAALGDGSEKDEEDEGARLLEGGSLDDHPALPPGGDGDGDDDDDDGGGGGAMALPSAGGVNGGVYGGINGAMNASAISAASMAAKKVSGSSDKPNGRGGGEGGGSGSTGGSVDKNGKPMTKDAKSGEKYSGDHTDSKNGQRNARAAENQGGRPNGNGMGGGKPGQSGKGPQGSQDGGARGMKPGDKPAGRDGQNGANGQQPGGNGQNDPREMQAGDDMSRTGQPGMGGQAGADGNSTRNPKASDGHSGQNGQNGQNGAGQNGQAGAAGSSGADGHRDAGSGSSGGDSRGLSGTDSGKDSAYQNAVAANEAADREIEALESQLAGGAKPIAGAGAAGASGAGGKGGGSGKNGGAGKGGQAGANGANGNSSVQAGPGGGKISASVSVSDIQKSNGGGPKVAAAAATGTGQDRMVGGRDSVHVSGGQQGSSPQGGKQPTGKSDPNAGKGLQGSDSKGSLPTHSGQQTAPSPGSIKRPTGVAAASFGSGVGEQTPSRRDGGSEQVAGGPTGGSAGGGSTPAMSSGQGGTTGGTASAGSGGGRQNSFARQVATAAAVGAVTGAITRDASTGAMYAGMVSPDDGGQTVVAPGATPGAQAHAVRAGESMQPAGKPAYVPRQSGGMQAPNGGGVISGGSRVMGRGGAAFVMPAGGGGGTAPVQAQAGSYGAAPRVQGYAPGQVRPAPSGFAPSIPTGQPQVVHSSPSYGPTVRTQNYNVPGVLASTPTGEAHMFMKYPNNVPQPSRGSASVGGGQAPTFAPAHRGAAYVASPGGYTPHDSVSGSAPRSHGGGPSLDQLNQSLSEKQAYANELRQRIAEQQGSQPDQTRRVIQRPKKRTRWGDDKSGGKGVNLANKKKLEQKKDDVGAHDFPDISDKPSNQ